LREDWDFLDLLPAFIFLEELIELSTGELPGLLSHHAIIQLLMAHHIDSEIEGLGETLGKDPRRVLL